MGTYVISYVFHQSPKLPYEGDEVERFADEMTSEMKDHLLDLEQVQLLSVAKIEEEDKPHVRN